MIGSTGRLGRIKAKVGLEGYERLDRLESLGRVRSLGSIGNSMLFHIGGRWENWSERPPEICEEPITLGLMALSLL